MAKLKSPLLSFEAHGALGDVLVYFNRGGTSYVRSKPQDPVSLSVAQGLLRDCFASAAVSAHSLTQGQKDYYASLAPDSAFCPWWNNFIGQYIRDYYEVPGLAISFIKSVQSVVGTILNGNTNVEVSIDEVVSEKSYISYLGVGAANDDPRNFRSCAYLIDGKHIRFTRATTPCVGDLICSAMIVEFEPDFVVSYQRVTAEIQSAETEGTKTINAVDLSKTIIFPAGFRCDGDVNADVWNIYLDFQNNTTLRARRVSTGSYVYSVVRILEFI